MNNKFKALVSIASFAAFVLVVSFISNNSPHAEVQAAISGASVSVPGANITHNSALINSQFSSSPLLYPAQPNVTFVVTPQGQAARTVSASVIPVNTPAGLWSASATVPSLPSNSSVAVQANIVHGPNTGSASTTFNTLNAPGAGLPPGPGWPWPGHTTNTSNLVSIDVVNVHNNGAQVRLNVGGNWGSGWNQGNNWNQGAILDRGIVYSRTNSSPWVYAPNTTRRRIDGGGTGSVYTNISGLPNGVVYHVRGWVRTNQGYFHSPHIRSFRTGDPFWGGNVGGWWGTTRDSFYVTTNPVTQVTNTTGTLSGTIHNRSSNSPVIERGFVWSSTNSQPTISHSSASVSGSGFGTFSHTLTGLTPNTRYYVSAYFRTPGRIFYGNVVNFTTNATGAANVGDEVQLSISFRSLHGPVVGSQVITSTVNQTLTVANLQPPAGFVAWPPTWSYRVTGSANLNVFVAQSGAVPPGIGGTPGFGQAGQPGAAFFPVSGNFEFRPDAAVSRGEVAQAIFNLHRGRQPVGPPLSFSDMQSSPFAEAVNFVSSMGYMIGYPDGTFRPGAQLTRGEMAAFINNIYSLYGQGQTQFLDMPPQHWASNFVALAADRSMIAGFPDGTFRPENSLTRAQAVALLVRAEGRSLAPISNQFFADVPQSHWAFQYIMSSATPRP